MNVAKRSLAQRVIALIELARQKVGAAVDIAHVYTNYEIGRMIVEEEQGGKSRADYGKKVLIDLSARLTAKFGRGWSVENLTLMRKFFLVYSDRCAISQSDFTKSRGEFVNGFYEIETTAKSASDLRKSKVKRAEDGACLIPRFALSWSHYLLLMRISDPKKREFYERSAVEGSWKLEQLARQIETFSYERIALSKDKDRAAKLLAKAPRKGVAEEPMKDPYVLEFLGLPDLPEYSESALEQRIIDHIEEFMLELGKGFTFVGRQSHISFDEDHYRPDLVFYNRLTRSFFVIDLKIGKVTAGDVGQMQMYVHYYDRTQKLPDENPTIGILLGSEVKQSVVEMTLPDCEKNQVFAKQFTAVIPPKATFQRIMRQEQAKFAKEKILALAAKREDVK